MWYVVYQIADGRAVSMTSVEPTNLLAVYAYKTYAMRDDSKMWDASIRDLVDRPVDVPVDRVEVILTLIRGLGTNLDIEDTERIRAAMNTEFESDELVR